MTWLLDATIVPLIAVGPAVAQFASSVDLVEVYATVIDSNGRPVTDLRARDFRVEEDGVEEPITTFAAGEFPLTVVLAIDRSFSMSGHRLDGVKRASAAFVGALRVDDEVSIMAVGSEIEVLLPPTSAKHAATFQWATLKAWGSTPLYDALWMALDAIQTRRGRRALLALSDGDDRGSNHRAAELIDRARRSDVLVYPVAVGRNRPSVFAELASVTGGRSLFESDPSHLERSLVDLAYELRTQYLLGYVPANRHQTGWHAIEVRVNRPGVRVRARDGYTRS